MVTATEVAADGLTGRYAIFDEIASGGMATVHLARLAGPVSFARTLAVKRLHPHLAGKPDFVGMFLEEARIAARVRHTNVVATLDIVSSRGETFLAMEYVHGETVARLLDASRAGSAPVPVPIACAIAVGVLQGLNAAHEATGERGEPLTIVHRDVSPQNVMVGTDGVARVIDFGIAHAAGRMHIAREGKGKLAYTAPEVVRGSAVARTADVYSAAVVLWEMLVGRRLFSGENDANLIERVLFADVARPSRLACHVPAVLDEIVLRGLARNPTKRFATARAMARAIEKVVPLADVSEVGEWVQRLAGSSLAERARKIVAIETGAVEAGSSSFGVDIADQSGDLPALPPSLTAGPHGGAVAWQTASAVRLSPLTGSASSMPTRPDWSRRRSRYLGLAVLGAAAVAMLGSLAIARRWQHATAPPEGPATPVISQEGLPSAVAAAALSGAEVTSTAAPATPIPSPSGPSSAAARGRARTAPTPRCNPPWIVDSKGIKQYRLECL
jgi:eukaryotic-like serine/threonine-protein kinase